MPEQEPPSSQEFDDSVVAEALGTRPATVRDVAYGEGSQYSLGRGDARLEIFSRTGVTRLTTPDVRVELFGGQPLSPILPSLRSLVPFACLSCASVFSNAQTWSR